MPSRSQETGTAQARPGAGPNTDVPLLQWWPLATALCCLVAGIALVAARHVLAGTGAMLGGPALALAWGGPGRVASTLPWLARSRHPWGASAGGQQAGSAASRGGPAGADALSAGRAGPPGAEPDCSPSGAQLAKHRLMPGDPDLYLDLERVEVQAVYVVDNEVFTQLRGGVGERRDPRTGDHRHIETSDVSLTWRCGGRRAAERLAVQLNEWEAKSTQLRLLAAQGRSALLIEMGDDNRWLVLPELRLAA